MENDFNFEVGDRIVVIKYGHLAYIKDVAFDALPEVVGKVGVISQIHEIEGKPKYAVDGIDDKYAWYEKDQLAHYKLTIN